MIHSSHAHLDEISKILASAILRIEAARSETKEIDKRYNGYLLDFTPHLSSYDALTRKRSPFKIRLLKASKHKWRTRYDC